MNFYRAFFIIALLMILLIFSFASSTAFKSGESKRGLCLILSMLGWLLLTTSYLLRSIATFNPGEILAVAVLGVFILTASEILKYYVRKKSQ